jgi:hypothetical protein
MAQIISNITKEVPETPTIGNNPHKLSKIIPKLNHGNPDIIHDLTHSNRKKDEGMRNNRYL